MLEVKSFLIHLERRKALYLFDTNPSPASLAGSKPADSTASATSATRQPARQPVPQPGRPQRSQAPQARQAVHSVAPADGQRAVEAKEPQETQGAGVQWVGRPCWSLKPETPPLMSLSLATSAGFIYRSDVELWPPGTKVRRS